MCGQRIPESSCAMKETVDIDILNDILRGGAEKIMQPVIIASTPATRMRTWNQFSQFESNTYRKNFKLATNR